MINVNVSFILFIYLLFSPGVLQLLFDWLTEEMKDLEVRTVKFPDSGHHYIETTHKRGVYFFSFVCFVPVKCHIPYSY